MKKFLAAMGAALFAALAAIVPTAGSAQAASSGWVRHQTGCRITISKAEKLYMGSTLNYWKLSGADSDGSGGADYAYYYASANQVKYRTTVSYVGRGVTKTRWRYVFYRFSLNTTSHYVGDVIEVRNRYTNPAQWDSKAHPAVSQAHNFYAMWAMQKYYPSTKQWKTVARPYCRVSTGETGNGH